MGILDFLFGKKPAQVEAVKVEPPAKPRETRQPPTRAAEYPQEKSEDAIYQEAFAKATSTITAPQAALQGLFRDHKTALFAGSPKDCDEVTAKHLAGTGWTWGEFDRWHAEFKARGEWPYMWDAFWEDEEDQEPPRSVEDVAYGYKMNEMKAILKKHGITIKPAPKNKQETREAFLKHITWSQIKDDALERHKQYLEDIELTPEKIEVEKFKILSQTICSTFRNLKKYHQQKQFIEYQLNVYNDSSFKMKVFSSGCPIEIAFAESFNNGKSKEIPPYFPGDRNILG